MDDNQTKNKSIKALIKVNRHCDFRQLENLYDFTIRLFDYWVLKGIKLRFFVFGWTMSGLEWIVA